MTPLWSPSPARIASTNMTRFMRFVRERHQAPIADYGSLYRWSVEYPENFWSSLWDFFEVRASCKATQILEDGNRMPGAQWFIGARCNYAENLLRLDDETAAIIFRNELGARRELSYRQLRNEVARIADGLRDAGVQEGDRVAGLLPNIPEAIIAMLAATSIGAIWSSCSPDLDRSAVCDRFAAITPKVLFAADGYVYAGETIDCLPTVRVVQEKISSIERLVIVPYLKAHAQVDAVADGVTFAEFGSADAKLAFVQLPADHPAFILYSSARGIPRCIVHCASGALLQQIKQLALHGDMKRGDRYFCDTDRGGGMWHMLASGLVTGATIVLFDGAALQPDPRVLWRMIEEEQLTIFDASPRFLTACEQAGVRPRDEFDLQSLRAIFSTSISTGSPLSPASCHYVYRDVKTDLHLASICGSTDSMACFGLGCPILPVYAGESQCLGLAMKVEVFDASGNALIDQPGDLVCTTPFPSVPLGFWADADGSRFQSTYFGKYPNAWWQGEAATRTARGGLIVHGRADDVLNPGAVR